MSSDLIDPALSYLNAGLCVLPAKLSEKHPTLSTWKQYQTQRPAADSLRIWMDHADAVCLITGAISGNLEALDFDLQGELFPIWCDRICEQDPTLLAKLLIETSPSLGYHVFYRCSAGIAGNQKLAQRKIAAPDDQPITVGTKAFKTRRDEHGNWSITITLIETRGEGGLILCAPSPGYEIKQGAFTSVPDVTADERELLIETAQSLNEFIPKPKSVPNPSGQLQRPGDDFNQRGDMRALLQTHGWTRVRSGENEHWRRPGKSTGCSATLKDGVFYVFSSNAAPFNAGTPYNAFAVYAQLEHGGDFNRAAAALAQSGFGQKQPPPSFNVLQLPVDDSPATVFTPAELFAFNPGDDPNTLLGDRWLCRGGSCLVVGQTGIGKSSFSMQAMILWALGLPVFGITPKRPLRSLIIQAENDVGDLAEMFRGVIHGTSSSGHLGELQSMLTFVSEPGRCGKALYPWLLSIISKYKPDLVWIDPLFAFLGGSASDQETVSKFLRNGLGTISQATGVTWMIVHHTNKPAKDPEDQGSKVASDYAYLSSGSSELANWPRAVLTLREVQDGRYELRAAKRGRRAGLVDSDGSPATEIYLKHGERGICWERALTPEMNRQTNEQTVAAEIIESLGPDQNYSARDIRTMVEREFGVKRQTVLTQGRPANRVYQQVLDQTSNPLCPGVYSRRPAHSENSEVSHCHTPLVDSAM